MFRYTTKVKMNLDVLDSICRELKSNYDSFDPTDSLRKVTKKSGEVIEKHHIARSLFTQWNNLQKLYERLIGGEIFAERSGSECTFDVEGKVDGHSARVYYRPSVTSLTKSVRKTIVPTDPNNVFVFFDLKAAEFIMNCVFCGETEATEAYQRGEDAYMHYAYIFPEGTSRETIKTILIAQMYGTTAYRVSKQLGVSETVAQRMLDMVARALPKMTMQKRRVIAYAMKTNAYWAPRGFNQQDLVKIAEVNPETGFSPDFALSALAQSALGFFMQDFITKLLPKTTGTLLTVFDSVLCEMKPESMQRYVDWVTKHISPFRADGFHYGKTFWEAAYGGQEVK